ncbi:MAG: RNA ligase partner protein [Candidatus Asgardarchaeia archaeon]
MRFVLDTSSITDARLREKFKVKELREVLERIIEIISEANMVLGFEFYTTPTLFKELRTFLLSNGCNEEQLNKLATWIIVRTPSIHEIRIPSKVMADYVKDMRRRIDKGLRVAEEAIKKAVETSKKNSTGDTNEIVGPIIRDLREKYRTALRKGIIDSSIDFDLVILAHELKATLVTSDEGIGNLCDSLGIHHINAIEFVNLVNEHLKKKSG